MSEVLYLLVGIAVGIATLGLWMRRKARQKKEAWHTLYVGPFFGGIDAAHTKVTLRGKA